MYLIESQVWIPRRRDEVFQFFSDAANLQRITPSWLNFCVLDMTTPTIERGTRINYRLKIRGLPIRWQSEIVIWEPPHRFVDHQVKGPYSLWQHEHRFVERDGGTECIDIVKYQPPGGLLAPAINRLFVAADVKKIFDFRRDELGRIFATSSSVPASTS